MSHIPSFTLESMKSEFANKDSDDLKKTYVFSDPGKPDSNITIYVYKNKFIYHLDCEYEAGSIECILDDIKELTDKVMVMEENKRK